MSKRSLKDRSSRKQTIHHKQKTASFAKQGSHFATSRKIKAGQQSKKKIVVFVIVAVLAAIPFGLGKYFELSFPDPYDSGAYVYSACHVLRGAKLGIDEKPSAQIGTLLINMLGVWSFGFNQTGPKLIQMVLQAAALVFMFCTMRKLFGILSAAVGVIIASVYLSAPVIAKFGNVKEQHMIAFMILGISCFVLRQFGGGRQTQKGAFGNAGGKWWWAVLAGMFVVWAPLFKATGTSAIAAIGVFVIAQPFLKHRTWKQTGTDILLLFAGATLSIGPIYIWLATKQAPVTYWPYSFAWNPIVSVFDSSQRDTEHKQRESEADESVLQDRPAKEGLLMKLLPGYVRDSWQILNPAQKKEVAFRVMRYYRLLILPIALAAGAIMARLVRMIMHRMGKLRPESKKVYDKFVLLFAVWWLLDMAYAWISPRSYEQYFLPLNASAAMLGGYLIALYWEKVSTAVQKGRWITAGVIGFACMAVMSWHIFFGVEKSPHTGRKYPQKRRGYAQKLNEISERRRGKLKGQWEAVGEYIRTRSEPEDKIYVWGWYPGIYVVAQRFSSTKTSATAQMHVKPPQILSEMVTELLAAFEKEPPKFIVDTHKYQFPWDRPPLELWPRTQKGFLPTDKQIIDEYDGAYSKMLHEKIEPDQALRYKAMRPFRDFVMKNYKIVGSFGQHILFELK